ncbi:MAG: hypothetical protein LC789_09965, partial [Actinobacteria bacterium]|nr:hypothetical protein [Actinomycetota bacterium]MCA1722576.1 hypothetical protein [Actinomycetota bacterium]
WAPVDPPAFLDHAGAEILLIGTSDDVTGDDELDIEPDDTTPEDMLAQLRLDAEEHPVEPLVDGAWA